MTYQSLGLIMSANASDYRREIQSRRAGTKMMTNMMRAFRAVVEIIVVVISSGSPEVTGA